MSLKRVTVGYASYATRILLRLLTDRGQLRAEHSMSLEEFNQFHDDVCELAEEIRKPIITVRPDRRGGQDGPETR